MPCLEVTTNVPKDKIPADFAKVTVDLIAKLLGKPASYVVVVIRSDATMSWAGDDSPAAVVHLTSIGQIDRAKNKKTSAALYPHFEKNLGISGERMYIMFHDMAGENVGYSGSTFG
ncbi:macrophage migration inhibitory factor-like protein [Leptotrombidium deliense]|uniref:L-dopachrome isomerase n=1 Tax=Leptotrombidium deliense TaxID=299467 RepID=A0A443SQF5_9ACAR|nr:macrophage migration inhibitory factor-like protein [Leptotrombidium deliense]